MSEPIVAEVVQPGPTPELSALTVLNAEYKALKSRVLVNAVVAVPLLGYGFLADKRWARWSGGLAILSALLQYQHLRQLNQQVTAISLATVAQGTR